MKKLQLFGLFVLMVVVFVSCGQSFGKKVNTETPKNWKLLDKPEFAIQYPDTFDLDTSGQMGMSFILLSQQTSPQDLFRENINLIIQDLSGQGMSLDKYVDISENQIETMITEGHLIESKRLSDDNKAFQRMIYTGKQGQFTLKWQNLFWIEDEKAYVLTLTCEENQYDKYVSIGETIMKTFVIK